MRAYPLATVDMRQLDKARERLMQGPLPDLLGNLDIDGCMLPWGFVRKEHPIPGYMSVVTGFYGVNGGVASFREEDLRLFIDPLVGQRPNASSTNFDAVHSLAGLSALISKSWTRLIRRGYGVDYQSVITDILGAYQIFRTVEPVPAVWKGKDFQVRLYGIQASRDNLTFRLEWRDPEELSLDLPAALFMFAAYGGETPAAEPHSRIGGLELEEFLGGLGPVWASVPQKMLLLSL